MDKCDRYGHSPLDEATQYKHANIIKKKKKFTNKSNSNSNVNESVNGVNEWIDDCWCLGYI